MAEIVQFINGSTTVDINTYSSIILLAWEPAYPPRRDSTHTSIYDDGSTLTTSQFDNIIETFTIAIAGSNQNSVIVNLRNLTSILELCRYYHIGHTTTPTYMKVKAYNETNTRYAIVKNYKIEKIPQVMGSSPFNTGIVSDGTNYPAGLPAFTLVVELDLWRSQPPGSYTTLSALGYRTFNGVYYGTTNFDGSALSASSSAIYVANRYGLANFSHIYRYDSSAVSYSTNQVGAAVPFNLFPSPIGVGDILYLGCQTTLANSGPFGNIAFDIGTAATTEMTIAWEYSQGAGVWGTLSFVSGDGIFFAQTGSRVAIFGQSSSWATDTVNGVANTLWLRARITALNGNSTTPTTTIKPYSVTWPFIEIQSGQVAGDIPLLARYIAKTMYYGGGTAGKIEHIIMGLRSTSRGTEFMSIWNASDEQNPTGVTFTMHGGGSLSNNNFYPTGRVGSAYTITGTYEDMVGWTVSSSYANQYIGRFRAFLHFTVTAKTGSPGADDLSLHLRVKPPDFPTLGVGSANSVYFETEHRSPVEATTNSTYYLDMGEISISSELDGETVANTIEVYVGGDVSAGMTFSLIFIDLALIPVDEWSCEVSSRPQASSLIDRTPVTEMEVSGDTGVSYLELDGTKKKALTSVSRAVTGGGIASIPVYNATTLPILQANSTQRLFFLTAGQNWKGSYLDVLKINSYGVARYLSLRGSS